jgi:hypothetical protein
MNLDLVLARVICMIKVLFKVVMSAKIVFWQYKTGKMERTKS